MVLQSLFSTMMVTPQSIYCHYLCTEMIQYASHCGYTHRAAASRTTKIALNLTSNTEKQTI